MEVHNPHAELEIEIVQLGKLVQRGVLLRPADEDQVGVFGLRPGEQREGVDLRLKRAPSYCLEGVLEGNSGPAVLSFTIQDQQATNGQSGDGGFFAAQPSNMTAADGKVRICQLYPGQYKLTVRARSTGVAPPAFFGASTVAVADKDVTNFRVQGLPPIDVPGEVVLEGDGPAAPADAKLRVYLTSVTEAGAMPFAQPTLPGQFSLDGVLMDDYELTATNMPAGYYVKDITYGTQSVLNRPLRPGSALSNSLRVVVGRDGGNLSAAVTDKDGKPVPDAYVVVLPDSAATDADFAAQTITGHTDQNGAWTSATLRPGKRLVVVSATPNDNTPETIARLQAIRPKAKEVEIAPGQTMQVKLEMPDN